MKVIVDIKAGLGNQLFCYAFGYAVAKKTGGSLIIDTSVLDRKRIKDRYLEILKFDLPYKKRISFYYTYNPFLKKLKTNRIMKRLAIGLKTKIYKEENHLGFDKRVFEEKENIYFDGYWQNYRYFDEYRKELTEIIKLKEPDAIREFQDEIEKNNSVSIHIRRGDYVSVGWEIPMQYYLDALELLKSKTTCSKLVAYVFSDDIDYAREFLEKSVGEDIIIKYMDYTNENKVVYDMYLMSCCKYNIIANSTYSWWAAYLSKNDDRIVICPETGTWNENFYLPEWIRIKV
ncbi:MAG: alpha-1,2-fucosyltransferase [Lachnospiraceae bacterium]|nr:alpha-1,2-fucosyltransferase [Lachnospiraceae bacterium]